MDVNRLTVVIAVAGSALIGALLSLVNTTITVFLSRYYCKLCYHPMVSLVCF